MKKILLLISLNIILFFSQFIFAYESKYFETINANADRYFLSIFRTDLIKICALTPGCSVYSLLQKSEKTPLFLLRNKKEDKFNRLNFTSWVGVYNPRQNEYENPYQADLYVLHELYHMVTMKYGNYKNLESWKDKIITNEKEASFYSEGLIYFELPKLRNLVPFKEFGLINF